ncbi:ATP-binding protein [Rhodocytophaga aerolata]|uniref:histidine kinase n=1 Tax=Rhodocytophaga aerolata TaxID=455078 RepID=A0ABT8RGE6_9BACT|nr:ATP-binding protein [Rhodocytophaga aerolata]MDO1450776.1 ATP-binding protein [Rhodocytophaga aerolata]
MDLLGSLEKKIVVGSIVALILLLIIGVVPLLSIQRLVASAEQLQDVEASLESLGTTLSHLKDIETGTRGFVITRRREFLEPYQSALAQLPHELSLLPGTLHAAKNRSYYLPTLHALITQKIALSESIIERNTKEASSQASQLQQIEQGKRLMDQIRVLISQMQIEERNLLSIREKQNASLITITYVVIIGCSLVAIFSVLFSIIFIRTDVVKRRKAEENLLKSEALLNEAQRIAKMGSWEYDVEKDQLSASDSLHKIFEVSDTKHALETSEQFYHYLHPNDRAGLQQASKQCIETGESFQTEYRLLLPGGNQKYILSYVRPLKEQEGNVRKVRGTCQDITELKYAQEALVQSEKLFSTIFKLIPFPTGITRLRDGKVIVANEKALQVFGYTALEVSNTTTIELKLWNNPQERELLVQQLKRQPILEFEKKYYTKEGKEWDAITYIEVIEWDNEPCLLIILQDITDRKRVEEAIKAYAGQLEELNASKDKFFSIIAHDLLSPLNGILGSADLLANQLNHLQEKDIQELSRAIYSSTTHLKKLLTNLLEWARMQKGELGFQIERVNLYKIACEEIASLQENARQKELTLDICIPQALLVQADEPMLRTVIRNLVANAIKFSNTGGYICIKGEGRQKQVQISVQDTGVGMSRQMQQKLFHLEGKQTSVGTAGEKGTGLGLMLCKEFIEKHGGKIWVESEPGKGSIFMFTLASHVEKE